MSNLTNTTALTSNSRVNFHATEKKTLLPDVDYKKAYKGRLDSMLKVWPFGRPNGMDQVPA